MKVTYFDIRETPCKAYLPESDPVRFAIVAVHGFGGSKESPTIRALAETLCPEGAAVYCFDLPAHGAHPQGGDMLNLGTCSDALLSVARYVASQHPVPKGVYGTSFGGYLSLLRINELEAVLGSFALVLRAPAVKIAETFETRILDEQLATLERDGAIELDFDRKIMVKKAFLEELEEHNVCVPYAKPLLVIHGTADDIVTPADISEFMAQNPLAELVQIQGAGHMLKNASEVETVVSSAREYYGRASRGAQA